jgi:hypothetical protein
MSGRRVFTWRSLHNFQFHLNSDELLARTDKETVAEEFIQCALSASWRPPHYDTAADLKQCQLIDVDSHLAAGLRKSGYSPGWRTIATFQPAIWKVSQRNRPAYSDYRNHANVLIKAIQAFLFTKGKKLYPERLLREMQYAGFTRASLLPVPTFMAAIKHFGLRGRWFDPCAGWGNRLLAAYLMDLSYCGTDPGICYPGLVRLNHYLGGTAELYAKKWQDIKWPRCGFVLTSPPFHDKEDYLDGVDYGKFDNWAEAFLLPLVKQARQRAQCVVLHVDTAMRAALRSRISAELPIEASSRHKAPVEWFVKLR